MDNSQKKEEQNFLNNELPDAVWKALIAEKLKELQVYMADCAKLDEELKDKKHEFDLWKIKTELKQKEQSYWKEAVRRLEAEEENLRYKIAVVDAGLSPKCREMAQEEKDAEDHCNKLKILWEKYKTEWESKPMAIEKRSAYKRFLQAKFNFSLLENKLRYQKQINFIREEIDSKRLQVAIINFAKISIERRKLENELQNLYENNEELRTNLALLRYENESRSSKSIDSACFLMPPPSTNFNQKSKDTSDTISVSTIVWEDLLLLDNESDQTFQNSNLLNKDEATKNNKEKIVQNVNLENELLHQKSMNLISTNELYDNSNIHNNKDNNSENEVQECSSTVNDNVETSYIESPPRRVKKLMESDCLQNNMDCSMSINSDVINEFCACSSSTVMDYEYKQSQHSEIHHESSLLDVPLLQNNSFKSTKNYDKCQEKDNEVLTNVPIVKSIENVTARFHFFRDDKNMDPTKNMFSSQFTVQSDLVTNKTMDEKQVSNKMEYTDNFSESNFETGKIQSRGFSPISNMETDFDAASALVSDVTFSSAFGYVSPSSDIKRQFTFQQATNFETNNSEKKELKPLLYGNMQNNNFMEQLNSTNFFDKDKKTTLF